MTKSILVIDTPPCCEDCPLYDADLMRCHYLKNEAYGVDALPKWCPLKPIEEFDAVPVRCKDCKHFFKSNEQCQLIRTRLHFYEREKRWTEDSFCSWGEKDE